MAAGDGPGRLRQRSQRLEDAGRDAEGGVGQAGALGQQAEDVPDPVGLRPAHHVEALAGAGTGRHQAPDQVVDVQQVDPVLAGAGEHPHAPGHELEGPRQHAPLVVGAVGDRRADDDGLAAVPCLHQPLGLELGLPVGGRRTWRRGLVGRPLLVPPVHRRGAHVDQPGAGRQHAEQVGGAVDVGRPQLGRCTAVVAGQVEDQPGTRGGPLEAVHVGNVARHRLHAGLPGGAGHSSPSPGRRRPSTARAPARSRHPRPGPRPGAGR